MEIVKPSKRYVSCRGHLMLFRCEELQEFECKRCQQVKKSKLVAFESADESIKYCNGCYGKLNVEAQEHGDL